MIYGLDFDGTLVTSFTGDPLPGAKAAIQPLRRQGVQSFIATNQAGPVFRFVTGDPKFPTVETVCENIGIALLKLSYRPDLVLLCCYSGKQGAQWREAESRVAGDFRWRLVRHLKAIDFDVLLWPEHRKPAPGMLLFAGRVLGGGPICYVGDMESDEIAACEAGAIYIDAAEWRDGGAAGAAMSRNHQHTAWAWLKEEIESHLGNECAAQLWADYATRAKADKRHNDRLDAPDQIARLEARMARTTDAAEQRRLVKRIARLKALIDESGARTRIDPAAPACYDTRTTRPTRARSA